MASRSRSSSYHEHNELSRAEELLGELASWEEHRAGDLTPGRR